MTIKKAVRDLISISKAEEEDQPKRLKLKKDPESMSEKESDGADRRGSEEDAEGSGGAEL